jgi:FkbM family methyltransferase
VLTELLKPHYFLRPRQAVRRLLQTVRQPRPQVVEIRLPWGLPLRVDTREDIGQAVWRLGVYDLAVSEALWRLIDPGELVLDVGAHVGYMTGIMALRSGASGKVLAFEPHPDLYKDLLYNLALCSWDRRLAPIEACRLALSDEIGQAYLQTGDDFARNRGVARVTDRSDSAIRVETATVDHVLQGRSAGLLKIDVEGHERRVLAGARESLVAGRIRIILYEAYAAEARAIEDDVLALGYTVFGLGRSLFGLRLAPCGRPPHLPPYDAPSYLATLDPAGALRRCAPRGWRVLHPPARERTP